MKKHLPTIFILVFFLSGFRVYHRIPYPVTEDSPVIYIKICDKDLDLIFEDNDLADSDPLSGLAPLTLQQVITDVLDRDFNGINSSFARIELYPRDPNAPHDGSSFTSVEEAEG